MNTMMKVSLSFNCTHLFCMPRNWGMLFLTKCSNRELSYKAKNKAKHFMLRFINIYIIIKFIQTQNMADLF